MGILARATVEFVPPEQREALLAAWVRVIGDHVRGGGG